MMRFDVLVIPLSIVFLFPIAGGGGSSAGVCGSMTSISSSSEFSSGGGAGGGGGRIAGPELELILDNCELFVLLIGVFGILMLAACSGGGGVGGSGGKGVGL